MRSPISPPDLQVLLLEADVAARRLCRKLRLSRDELADLRQDLLTDLIARYPAFDPERGSIGAFAGVVMANRATRIAQGVHRHRRMYGEFPASLDDLLPNSDGGTRGDLISEADSISAILGQSVDQYAEVEHRMDVERGLGVLDKDQRFLAAALTQGSPHQLARRGIGSRSDLYRRTQELRLTLLSAGLGRIANGVGRG